MSVSFTFWRRTPPALFPCLLGFLGLALAWRRAVNLWSLPSWISEAIAAVAVSLFVVTFLSYLAKLMARPLVVMDDMKIVPARGAVSAGSMCLMAIAPLVLPYGLAGARMIWLASVGLHLVYMLCVIWAMVKAKEIFKHITPPIFLPFIGIIVAAASGPSFGYNDFSAFLLVITLPIFALICIVSLVNLVKGHVPRLLHPSYAIVVAPTSVYGAGAFVVWPLDVFFWFWLVSLVAGLATVPFWKWLIKDGWSPAWGSFTFPLASFSTTMLMGIEADYGVVATTAAVIGLILATTVIPYVVWKTYRFWFTGNLAQATGAAVV